MCQRCITTGIIKNKLTALTGLPGCNVQTCTEQNTVTGRVTTMAVIRGPMGPCPLSGFNVKLETTTNQQSCSHFTLFSSKSFARFACHCLFCCFIRFWPHLQTKDHIFFARSLAQLAIVHFVILPLPSLETFWLRPWSHLVARKRYGN